MIKRQSSLILLMLYKTKFHLTLHQYILIQLTFVTSYLSANFCKYSVRTGKSTDFDSVNKFKRCNTCIILSILNVLAALLSQFHTKLCSSSFLLIASIET